jgi:hypothetical protein
LPHRCSDLAFQLSILNTKTTSSWTDLKWWRHMNLRFSNKRFDFSATEV